MDRIVEPELMELRPQAEAYAAADFTASDSLFMQLFKHYFSLENVTGSVLDLGCGPGNITFRFAEQSSQCHIIGIDGSAEMLRIAHERLKLLPEISRRIHFQQSVIPHDPLPAGPYNVIISNSFLHHLHRPEILWALLNRHANKGCKILIMDLFRPETTQQARSLVEQYASVEPEILQQDFYNSLLAAFTPDEVKQQLDASGWFELEISQVSDRHMIIVGEKS